MKTRLLFALLGLTALTAYGQQLAITVEGASHVSGTQYMYTANTNTRQVNALVKNISGAPLNLTVKRVILNTIPSWKDDLCWGSSSSPLDGQCYNGIQGTNPYTTPHVQIVNPGDNGIFLAKIEPKDPDYGCGEYRYYIMNGATIMDSIDISVCKTADVDELTPFSITIAPNPASSYFTIKTTGSESASLKVMDVLGNVVMKETIMGTSKTINTESFKNGVYFIVVESEDQKPINRKVIVRH
jgi:Secretion system C-terminal sorting domain